MPGESGFPQPFPSARFAGIRGNRQSDSQGDAGDRSGHSSSQPATGHFETRHAGLHSCCGVSFFVSSWPQVYARYCLTPDENAVHHVRWSAFGNEGSWPVINPVPRPNIKGEMGMGEFVDMAGLVGAVTRYFNSAALQQEAGAVALIMLSLCMAGGVIGLLWMWRQERKR